MRRISDSTIPRNAPTEWAAPLDLIGHSSHRFDTAPRLDPAVVRAILKSELPTTGSEAGAADGGQSIGRETSDRFN